MVQRHLVGLLITCPSRGMRIWSQGPAIGERSKGQFHEVRDHGGETVQL